MNSRSMIATALTVLLMLIVGFATLTPADLQPSVGGGDKLHHLLAFAALALPTAALTPRRLPLILVVLAVFGSMIEVIQPFVGRSRELADLIADLGGLAIGSLTGLALAAGEAKILQALRALTPAALRLR